MKQIGFLLMLLIGLSSVAQNVILTGFVGKYPIEMELWKVKGNKIGGKYNYKGKTSFLNLSGSIYDNSILEMEESYGDEQTGTFFVEKYNDTLKGKWVSGTKWHNTYLLVKKGKLGDLSDNEIEILNKKTNKTITGCYVEDIHFINDMWFNDNNPQIEVGYNGGFIMVKELNKDSIEFTLQKICGPTYHFAFASGIATRINDSTFRYQSQDEYSDDVCEFDITISKDKTITTTQISSTSACGFGARAYADGIFTKIKNGIVTKEGEIELNDIYKVEK